MSGALRINANLFQTGLSRSRSRRSDPLELEENPGSKDKFELAIHDTGYLLPGWQDEFAH